MPTLPDPSLSTAGVVTALRNSGYPLREWGTAMDGTPMLAAQAGGTKQPAIFITAGVHCTETAGIHAALELLASLETEHEIHVLPMRDPVGFAGPGHCLSLASGNVVPVDSPEASLTFLQERAELVWSEDDLHLYLLDDIGFLWGPPRPGLDTWTNQINVLHRLPVEAPDVLAPLRGRHVFFLNSTSTVEGSGDLQRCYHTYVGDDGRWLHLNRFFGQDDAPPEVAAVDRLLRTIRPGLTLDLHEGQGRGFWMPIHRPKRDEDAELVFEMTRAFFDYITERSYPVTTHEEWTEADQRYGRPDSFMQHEPRLKGLFWVHQEDLTEGPNFSSYQSKTGIASGTEGPMVQPLAMRVDGITNGTRRGIAVWEEAQ